MAAAAAPRACAGAARCSACNGRGSVVLSIRKASPMHLPCVSCGPGSGSESRKAPIRTGGCLGVDSEAHFARVVLECKAQRWLLLVCFVGTWCEASRQSEPVCGAAGFRPFRSLVVAKVFVRHDFEGWRSVVAGVGGLQEVPRFFLVYSASLIRHGRAGPGVHAGLPLPAAALGL